MSNFNEITVIGVRHLSPASALCVVKTLEEVQPELVLIEGPADATHLIKTLLHEEITLPISLLAYNQASNRTLAYPLVNYSPEYQAMKWGYEHQAEVRFIDLPAKTFLALNEADYQGGTQNSYARVDIYQELASRAGENSYDAYWERNFEHQKDACLFKQMTYELGATLRELELASRDFHHAENLTREAYMRRCINDAIRTGVPAEKIAVVLGAYHAPVMNDSEHIMTDKEFKALPVERCHVTLMPYSYYRLSRQAGYGAGNCGPLYFGKLWQSFLDEDQDYREHYFVLVADHLRRRGHKLGTAAVIEASQLCRGLAALKEGAVVLEDLQSAAESLLFESVSREAQQEIFAAIEVGSAVGFIPEGLVMSSIQDDFIAHLKKLNLSQYKTDSVSDLKLDLRENRRVKSKEAAFRDLNRSSFFHRLNFLKIPFAQQREDDDGTQWQEKWFVRWRPESEIALVENILWGETLKAAVHARFSYEVQQCNKLVHLCRLLKKAVYCNYHQLVSLGLKQLQKQSVSGVEFVDLSHAVSEISLLINFGSIRRLDLSAFEPLLEQLFFEACLLIYDAADCNEERQADISQAMKVIDRTSKIHGLLIDKDRWLLSLSHLAASDERNPNLSGLAFALLIEHGKVDDLALSTELSRRLSPGMASDIAIGWFEGLISHNALELLHRQKLWESTAEYVASLSEEEFHQALVLLRRSFSEFTNDGKIQIAQNLKQIWGLNESDAGQLLAIELSVEESAILDELDDFDF
jgi:hypothetical protein